MDSFNYLSEFVLNIEDLCIEVICDNPPDEISEPYQKSVATKPKTLHNHIYFELFCVNNESITIRIENTILTLENNSVAIIPPLVHHSIIKTSSVNNEAFNFLIKPNKLKSSFPLYDRLSKKLSQPYSFFDDENISKLAHELFCSIEAGEYPQISMLFHRFILLIVDAEKIKANHIAVKPVDSNMKRLYKIQQIITRNFYKDLKLEAIAESLFLSTRQVNRLINQHFGCSFKEYLTQQRLNYASELLTKTELSISEIYQKAGYNTAQAFYTAFQNHYSCTPAEHREKNK